MPTTVTPIPLATYYRPLALTATWFAFVALATGCFYAPKGMEAQPELDDYVGFGCSLAISSVAAAIAAFVVGGRRRWAIELTAGVVVLSTVIALLLAYFFWYDPTLARRHMNLWGLQRIQHRLSRWPTQVLAYHGPLGAAVGGLIGIAAGLLLLFAHRKPRAAMGIVLMLLFAFASTPGRQFAVDQVTWLGWRFRYSFVPWSISDDDISITATIFGAIAGAMLAGLAMYTARRKPSG